MSRIRKADLIRYIDSYQSIFPNWEKFAGIGYVRASGPFVQQFWLDDLSTGDYRPTNTVSTLFDGCSTSLCEFLHDPRYRYISTIDHDRIFANVCDAIKTDFRPNITRPFDESESLRLFEAKGTDLIKFTSPLVYLYAYYGDLDKANSLIATVRKMAKSNTELYDWEQAFVNSVESLAGEMENGTHNAYLFESRKIALAEYLTARQSGKR